MITTQNISKSYGDRVLFKGVNINIKDGDKIALVGPNGSGKTTFMDILSGETGPDNGNVSVSKNTKIGYLTQELSRYTGRTLMEEVLSGALDIVDIRRDIEKVRESISICDDSNAQNRLLKNLATLEKRLEEAERFHEEHEAEQILSGLGFHVSDFNRNLNEFSGGWAMRAALAKLLYSKPSVLLLDEPTNHLDLQANIWFERYLAAFPGSVLITSHDKTFLNRTVNTVLSIEPDSIMITRGNYDSYLIAKEQLVQRMESQSKRIDREIKKQMQFVDRFRAKARKASQVQSRLKQIEKIERIEVPRSTNRVHYTFPDPPRSGLEVISLSNVCKSYGDTEVYSDLNLSLYRNDKVALVGPNGAGKTTLLKMLANVIEIDNGQRKTGHNVSTAYYAQHLLEQLDPSSTIIGELRKTSPDKPEGYLRNILGGFLFQGDDVYKPVSVLSGGEKARVALAKLLIQPTNLLLMDEPTNHLDIESREILADALSDYKGTLCLITHDRSLMSQACNKIIEIENGSPIVYEGNYESYQYHRLQIGSENAIPKQNMADENNINGSENSKKNRKPLNALKQQITSLKREQKLLNQRVIEIDMLVTSTEQELSTLEKMFNNPAFFKDNTELSVKGETYEKLSLSRELLMTEWENLSSRSDEIEKNIRKLEG